MHAGFMTQVWLMLTSGIALFETWRGRHLELSTRYQVGVSLASRPHLQLNPESLNELIQPWKRVSRHETVDVLQ